MRISTVLLVGTCIISASILPSQQALAGCAANDRICNDAVNNQAARQKEADDARTKQLNQQNGTSQYSGPTAGRSNLGGTPYIGYQKSIK
jgi:hypothetical protein